MIYSHGDGVYSTDPGGLSEEEIEALILSSFTDHLLHRLEEEHERPAAAELEMARASEVVRRIWRVSEAQSNPRLNSGRPMEGPRDGDGWVLLNFVERLLPQIDMVYAVAESIHLAGRDCSPIPGVTMERIIRVSNVLSRIWDQSHPQEPMPRLFS